MHGVGAGRSRQSRRGCRWGVTPPGEASNFILTLVQQTLPDVFQRQKVSAALWGFKCTQSCIPPSPADCAGFQSPWTVHRRPAL